MRSLLGVVLSASFATLAFAQTADNPGLAQPTPKAPGDTPAPTAPATPAPPPTTTTPAPPPPPTTTPAPTTPAPTTPPPPSAAPSSTTDAANGETTEKVETKIEYLSPDPRTPNYNLEFYDRLAAPTMTGGVGLLRTYTGDIGAPRTLRIALHVAGFQQDSFLVSGNSTLAGDTNQRFTGDLTIGYTIWKYTEVYLSLFNSSNRNQRTDTGRSDPEVILALGDLQFGAKGKVTVAKFLDLGLHLGVKFLNSVSGISFNGDSTNFAIDAIMSADFRKLQTKSFVPLRLTLNAGFLLDNSLSLLPAQQCALSDSNDACIRSRVVETFAYGIGSSRVRLALAIDAPITVKSVGLQPFLEYHVDVAVDSGDSTIAHALASDATLADRIDGRASQYLTLGLRVRPLAGLLIDAGLDVGMQSPGFVFGAPVPAWNLIFGLGYAYDALGSQGKTKVVTKTITTAVPKAPMENAGHIRGVILDAATHSPIADAVVRYPGRSVTPQATDSNGAFYSYALDPGPATLEVTKDAYKGSSTAVVVTPGSETKAEILLTLEPPQPSQLRGVVLDESGAPIAATVRLTGGSGSIVEADMEKNGSFSAKLPPGDYTMDVEAPNMKPAQRVVTIAAGQLQNVEIVLQSNKANKKASSTSRVNVTKNEIALKGKIHFKHGGAEIAPDGEQLLDEVVDALKKNPQITKVRVEGHTDNSGSTKHNLDLSKERAESVVAYLVKQGIDKSRLEAQGYGSSRPLVPNLTPSNRARNRRVTLRILAQ